MAKKHRLRRTRFPANRALIADTEVRGKPFAELGWAQGDPAGMKETRDYLAANNGIRGLERLQPTDIDDAVRIFYRDGFVVVENVLDEQQLRRLNQASERVIRDILAKDKNRRGNRGSHRYSFGSASVTGQLLHEPAWAMLADLPTLTPIISALFGQSRLHPARRWRRFLPARSQTPINLYTPT